MTMNLLYYHGSLCRSEAESILEKINTPGSFLIRNSETMSGCYTLCLWADDGYHQYRIINEEDGLFVKAEAGVEEIKYPSLAHLIDYYQNQSSANGLAAPLRLPVPFNSTETVYDLKKSTDVKEILACYFQHKFRYERHFRFNTTFYYVVERYLETGLAIDLEEIHQKDKTWNEMKNFRGMIFEIMKTFFESVNDVIKKLNFLNSFFGNTEDDCYDLNFDESHPEKLIENLESMRNLSCILRKVESNVITNLSQRLSYPSYNPLPNGLVTNHDIPPSTITTSDNIAIVARRGEYVSSSKSFEIEFSSSQYHSLQVHCVASVDIITATMKFELLHTKTRSVFKHITINCDSIEKVMKSDGNPQRLLIREGSSSGYFYIDFVNESSRTEFLHCIYGAKRYQEITINKPNDCLSVFVGTWNIGCSKPPDDIDQWLKCQGSGNPLLTNVGCYVPHDLYVIAIQEDCWDQHWDVLMRSNLQRSFQQDFKLISTKSNSFPKTLKLSLFCRSTLEKFFKNVTIDAINTGFANKCGNKGAVSISFNYQDASICLINCHLASGEENVKRREDEFGFILQRLHGSRDKNGHADLLQRYDFVFATGDYNMRTDTNVTEAIRLLQNNESHSLLQSDELTKYHMAKPQNPFKQFKEPTILHGPTYRYLKGTRDNLDPFKKKVGKVDKINCPSWCDRVLYKARDEASISPLSYGIHLDSKVSDHKPVFSSFLLALPPRDYLQNNIPKSSASLRIDEILLKVSHEWKSKRNFQIQIEGNLLAEPYISLNPNLVAESPESKVYIAGHSKLKDLLKIIDLNKKIALLFLNPFNALQLKAGVTKRDIETNYISVSILVNDNRTECIANTVIPMSRFATSQSHSFELHLYEHGSVVGSMIVRGAISTKYPDNLEGSLYPPRLIDLFGISHAHDESKPYSRSLFDLINERDTNNNESKRVTCLNSNTEEGSAFRPIISDSVNLVQTVRHLSSLSNNVPASLSKMNGMCFSNTTRIPKTKDVFNGSKELQNHTADLSSKYSCSTLCNTRLCEDVCGDNGTRRNLNCYEDSTLMTVHNESYSTALVRGELKKLPSTSSYPTGVTSKTRNMDARVDLSKLEADMGIIQPPLPPRYSRKNVRPVKTRQDHSNPISMASSSGSSYNANSIGDSSAASAEPSSCFVNQESEFEDPINEGYRKQGTYGRTHTSQLPSKDAARMDSSSKQSTITGSTNHICPSSGHYVQAIGSSVSTNHVEDKFIEPYASNPIISESKATSSDRKMSYEIEYVMLQRPLDLRDWLNNLCVPQAFIEKLVHSSFNNLELITLAKDEDLRLMGISDANCRGVIIHAISSLLHDSAQVPSSN